MNLVVLMKNDEVVDHFSSIHDYKLDERLEHSGNNNFKCVDIYKAKNKNVYVFEEVGE